ncbi:MAG: AAA family ATPase, partial [Acidobacteriota bacterium]
YRFVPDALRALARPGDGARLASDGSNLPSVVERVARESPDAWRDVVETVATITDGLVAIEREALGPYETLCARRVVAGARHPWKFYASELSDGTLHALATLAAVHQDPRRRHGLSLAALSEPTAALHPAAVAALAGALQRAARHTQILATSHSPELIDALESASGAGVSQLAGLLLARIDDGVTTLADAAPPPGLPGAELGPPAGTLLREDRLRPRRRARRPIDQLDLFAPGDGVD